MNENKCPILSPSDLEANKKFLNQFVKEKEQQLNKKQTELENIPTKYVVRQTIEKEVEDLSSQIKSMKELAKKFE